MSETNGVNLVSSFSIIPKAVTRSPLSIVERAVYIELVNHGTSTDNCFPSVARLASYIGCSESAVHAALRTLAKWGWVEKVVRWDGPLGESRQQSNSFNVYDQLDDRQPQARFKGKTCREAWDAWVLAHHRKAVKAADERLRAAASQPRFPAGSVKELQRLRPFRVTRREAMRRLNEVELSLGLDLSTWPSTESEEGAPPAPPQDQPETGADRNLGGCTSCTPRGVPDGPLGVHEDAPHEVDQLNDTNLRTPTTSPKSLDDTPAPPPGGGDGVGSPASLFVVPSPAPTPPARRQGKGKRPKSAPVDYSPEFETWWKLYPSGGGKKREAWDAWQHADHELVTTALHNYRASIDAFERKHGVTVSRLNATTFLNGRADDWADGLFFPRWPTKPEPVSTAEKFDRMDDLVAVMNQAIEETGAVPSPLDAFMRGPQRSTIHPPPARAGAIDIQEISA